MLTPEGAASKEELSEDDILMDDESLQMHFEGTQQVGTPIDDEDDPGIVGSPIVDDSHPRDTLEDEFSWARDVEVDWEAVGVPPLEQNFGIPQIIDGLDDDFEANWFTEHDPYQVTVDDDDDEEEPDP